MPEALRLLLVTIVILMASTWASIARAQEFDLPTYSCAEAVSVCNDRLNRSYEALKMYMLWPVMRCESMIEYKISDSEKISFNGKNCEMIPLPEPGLSVGLVIGVMALATNGRLRILPPDTGKFC